MIYINIPNKTRRYLKGYSPSSLRVPAPCMDLTRLQQNEWFVRAFYEFKNCVDNGGSVWFPTLTYDNKHIHYFKDDLRNVSFPCFSSDDILKFRTKLNVYLKRCGFDFTGNKKIRYLACAEFGGKYGRPHYHCLLFVPSKIDFKLFSFLIKKSWSNGFVMYSKNGMQVNSVHAIKYVMKYISKDFNYLKKYNIYEYLSQLRKDKDYDTILEVKKVLPRHYQSLGFGLCGLKNITLEDFKNNYIPSSKLNSVDNSNFNYPVPRYYKYKFMYDWNKKDKLYDLNKNGYIVYKYQYDKIITSLKSKYSSFLNNLNYWKSNFPNWSFLIDKYCNNIDIDLLSVYSLSYRFRVIPDFFNDMLKTCKIVRADFIDTAFDIFIRNKDVKFIKPSDSFRHDYYKYTDYFNSHPLFRGFDNFLNLFDTFSNVINSKKDCFKKNEFIRLADLFGKDNYIIV